ncbi:MAG: hypothetical protein AB7F98_14670 [Novosphingobium sp.]
MGKQRILSALAAFAALAGAPAASETVERIDWLSMMTDRGPWGVQLAREQMAQGQLLEAMATLERVLAASPDEGEAHLLHASLLCRVDDPEGAAMEFDMLHKLDFPADKWAEANAACSEHGISLGKGR